MKIAGFLYNRLLRPILFADYKGLPGSGGYPVREGSAILTDRSRTDPFERDGSFREVPVHFFYPETGEEEPARFPLVIFSHGAFGYYKSNYSTYTELAGNGYLVAALDHPHHALFTKNTKGRTLIVDKDFLFSVRGINSETDAKELDALHRQWMNLRVSDMSFALEELKAAAQAGTVDGSWFFSGKDGEAILSALKRTDVTRIGVMGHSMGGAAAVELGRVREDISAVVDLDGTMLGEYLGVENDTLTVREEPYVVPVLEFVNWESYQSIQELLARGLRYPNDVLMRGAAEGILDEGCSLSDTEICIDIIDQFIEADKNNFVTKVMIKINRE